MWCLENYLNGSEWYRGPKQGLKQRVPEQPAVRVLEVCGGHCCLTGEKISQNREAFVAQAKPLNGLFGGEPQEWKKSCSVKMRWDHHHCHSLYVYGKQCPISPLFSSSLPINPLHTSICLCTFKTDNITIGVTWWMSTIFCHILHATSLPEKGKNFLWITVFNIVRFVTFSLFSQGLISGSWWKKKHLGNLFPWVCEI